jgi:hypothetical protein
MAEHDRSSSSPGPAAVPPATPEADVSEHAQEVSPPAEPRPAWGLEVPEADAWEQAQDVGPSTPPPRPAPGLEVPEADAWEQAQEVVVDDEER